MQKLVDDEKVLKKNEIPKSQLKDKKQAQKDLKKSINKESLTSLEGGITKSQEDLRESVDNLKVSSLIKYAKKKLQEKMSKMSVNEQPLYLRDVTSNQNQR